MFKLFVKPISDIFLSECSHMFAFVCSVQIKSFPHAVSLWQNLLEKAAERETRQEYALAMIQCKVLKQLENLEQQKYDDEDITEDIKFLLERLGESVQDLRYLVDSISWGSFSQAYFTKPFTFSQKFCTDCDCEKTEWNVMNVKNKCLD